MVANQLKVVIEKTSTGFSAYAQGVPSIIAVGDTLVELKENIQDSLECHVEYLQEEGKQLNIEDFDINYVVDLEQFFEYFSVINKTEFAKNYAHVNPSLMRQYTKGLTKLSSNKLLQISEGLRKLASEIDDLSFA